MSDQLLSEERVEIQKKEAAQTIMQTSQDLN